MLHNPRIVEDKNQSELNSPQPEHERVKAAIKELAEDPDYAYAIAYLNARRELEEIIAREKRDAIRKAQLRETLKALRPLVTEDLVDVQSLTLADAIRLVISSAGKPLTSLAIRDRLESLDYDLKQFQNPMASIHTALERMHAADELRRSSDDKKKEFEPGPELKPVPVNPAFAGLTFDSLPDVFGDVLPTPRDEKKK